MQIVAFLMRQFIYNKIKCNICFPVGDTRALALSLFSEIATVFLTQDTVAETGKVDAKQLNAIIGEKLFPQ